MNETKGPARATNRMGLVSSEFWLPVLAMASIVAGGTQWVVLDSEAQWIIAGLGGGYGVARTLYKNKLADKIAPAPQADGPPAPE